MAKENGITFVMVTHERELAGCADRVVTISDGNVQSDRVLTEEEKAAGRAALGVDQLEDLDVADALALSLIHICVPACQKIVKKAVVERLKKGHKVLTLPETGALYKLRFSIRKNRVEICLLYTSGTKSASTGMPRGVWWTRFWSTGPVNTAWRATPTRIWVCSGPGRIAAAEKPGRPKHRCAFLCATPSAARCWPASAKTLRMPR